jgi:hypothetical protein
MSAMTRREIVKRCIEFRDPPRIAWDFRVAPIDGYGCDETDFACVGYGTDPNFHPAKPGFNEWGYRMETVDPTGECMGEARDNPLAAGWNALETYRWPDVDSDASFAGIGEAIAAGHSRGKYVYGTIPSLMLLPIALRGMENWFLDHGLHEDMLAVLLEHILANRKTVFGPPERAQPRPTQPRP